ncbi:HAMP domain-containing protein [Aquamicrobium sp. LC103]|nr:HAMP domain-containing protein [Aquamicrobium sp. LC103]
MAATLIPALIFSVILLQRSNQAQQEIVTTLAEATAGSIAETIDRQLMGTVTTLRVLAATPSLGASDLSRFYDGAKVALEGTGAHLIVVDENMNQLLDTRSEYSLPLGRLQDTAAAAWALHTGEPVVSDGVLEANASRWGFNVIQPPLSEEGPRRLLVMTQDAERLSEALASQNLRGGWNAVLVDRNDIVLASSYMSSDIGKPFFLAQDIEPNDTTVRRRVRLEDRTYETITTRSSLTGWEVIVWAPSSIVQAPMTQTLRALAIGGAAIIAIGAILAWALGRQVAKPVRRLAQDARRLGAGEAVEAVDFPVAEIATVSAALAQAAQDRRAAESEIRFLMREVAHRSKNQLTVVSSIAKQTARTARSFAAFQDSFQKRVQGLARSTDLLVAGGVAGVELRELLNAQIEPFRPSDASRLEVNGNHFRLSNQAAQTLGLAIHELATNAAKYGAFAASSGRLVVSWSRSGDRLEMRWREFVPRLRRRAESRGFGTEVIERMLGGTLDAEIERTLHRDGIEYRFRMPLERVEPELSGPAE